MVWMMLAIVGIKVQEEMGFNQTQYGILIALPVLSGSLIRVPLGILTDKYGGRIVLFALMIISVPAIFLMQYATEYWHFLIIGLLMGLAGGSFSVGTPYVARWFPKEQQGMAMVFFFSVNSCSAVNKFLAAWLITVYGTWQIVPTVYSAIMLAMAIIFWFTSYHDPKHLVSSSVTLREQLALLKDPGVLRYSQYYSVVFGGYVALALWMTKYYPGEYGMSLETAAFLAACFSLPGGVLRAFGGYLSDKFGAYKVTWAVMWVCWVCFFLLSYPQTELAIQTKTGVMNLHIGLSVTVFTILMFTVGVATAVGKASVFKFVADDYPHNIGAVSGIFGLAGCMGGFLLPIMFGALEDFTGVRSTSFMLLYGTVCVSLIWMHFSFKAKRNSDAAK